VCFESSMYHGVMPRSWRRGYAPIRNDSALLLQDSRMAAHAEAGGGGTVAASAAAHGSVRFNKSARV
jgi:hypothetical protein